MTDLTILHTNDLHGKLSDRAAETIARERSSSGPYLLLDAGDAVSSGNVYYRPGGEPILARMSELGYDALALGNREFHFLGAGLRSKVKLADFPILCANLRSKDSDIVPSVRPSAEFDVVGRKVVVFGLTVPMIKPRTAAAKISPFWFEDPLAAAAKLVPELRRQADLLIALTHMGLPLDMELAKEAPGIDLIVGGHSHNALSEPAVVGDTAIVHAGWWGHYLGQVHVSFRDTGRPVVESRLLDLRQARE